MKGDTNMKTYKITINFAGFYGCDEEYTVYAESREEAEEEALQCAIDDLSIMECEEDDED